MYGSEWDTNQDALSCCKNPSPTKGGLSMLLISSTRRFDMATGDTNRGEGVLEDLFRISYMNWSSLQSIHYSDTIGSILWILTTFKQTKRTIAARHTNFDMFECRGKSALS